MLPTIEMGISDSGRYETVLVLKSKTKQNLKKNLIHIHRQKKWMVLLKLGFSILFYWIIFFGKGYRDKAKCRLTLV